MRREYEDKKLGAAEIETKEVATKIDATNCPEREHHKQRLGMICGGCSEAIPSGGAYSPEQFARYFGSPLIEQPASPFAMSEHEKNMWHEYDLMRAAHEEAQFKVLDIERGRKGARGNDPDAGIRGANFDAAIADAKARAEKLHEGMSVLLLEIQRLGLVRGAKHRKALWEESYPADAPLSSLGARIAAALRGVAS